MVNPAEAIIQFRKRERYPWIVPNSTWDTNLDKYALHGLSRKKLSFRDYLIQKIAQASKERQILRVLDIGMGSGEQWLDFLKQYKIEFFGTATLMSRVVPALQERVRLCSAGGLYKRFPKDFFDIIVTHWGAHHQEAEAVENAIHLLKPGGEAILTFSGDRVVGLEEAAAKTGLFEFVEGSIRDDCNFIHIRKLDRKPETENR